MRSWKTTFAGCIPGLLLFFYGFLQGLQEGKLFDFKDMLIGAGLCLLGGLAKDFNISGSGAAKAILALILIPCVLSTGCARIVTIPSPTAIAACPDSTEKIKAIASSNLDPALKPTIISNVEATARDVCLAITKAHQDEYSAQLARAQDAAKSINSWVVPVLQFVLSGGLAAGIAAWTR